MIGKHKFIYSHVINTKQNYYYIVVVFWP